MVNILVVDDEQAIRESIKMFMCEKGHMVHTASTMDSAVRTFGKLSPEVVILDIRLPDGSGLDALSRMHSEYPLSKIIMITAFQDMETTIEAMKRGAYDYIHKPLDANELEKTVNHAITSFYEDTEALQNNENEIIYNESEIVGKSRIMKEIYKTIGMLCRKKATVLITGETGTGKELIARQIHLSSFQSDQPFVIFDCSSVVGSLFESELFGHEKGAFTGAVDSQSGSIELAGEGTLFIDEIGEIPLHLQGKLLGFLERKQYLRVGGKNMLQSNCRIIAATNKNLANLVSEKKFRDDLYYRLKVVTMNIPPLRQRLDDINDLVKYFTIKNAQEMGIRIKTLQKGCIERLKNYHWPGNVRELENIIIAASIKTRGNVILLKTIDKLLADQFFQNDEGTICHDHTLQKERNINFDSLSQMENRHIFNVLQSVQWNKTKAAEILKISLPTLRKKIKKYNLSPM